ncbi:NAD(P)H-hydrate dehydratase [Streptomyces longispororuber]|uniref:NAD(P)H-hydrate dehydratase n=1 Tax=Streptomyces longispororuber TaxID=68230 RepID=UPI0037033E73
MRTAYRVEDVRAAERALMARVPDGALMQRAAAGLAAACGQVLKKVYGARVALLVGSGDNGGDALYAGARLARRGAGVTAVLLAPERTHAGGLAALRAAGGRVVDGSGPAGGASTGAGDGAGTGGGAGAGTGGGVGTGDGAGVGTGADAALAVVARADLVVDGVVGIGGKGGLRPRAAELARAAERSKALVVAVDLPSGVDADTGEVRGAAVRADVTVTFGACKPGLLIDPAREYAGALRFVDIGLGPELAAYDPVVEAFQYADVDRLLPVPGAESDKYRRGVVGVVAGSARYPGAAVLAVAGALRGGAGAVRYVGPAADAVLARFPETLVSAGPPAKAGRVQAWAVGSGLGDDEERLHDVVAADVPVLIDADGLRLADAEAVRRRVAPTLLTPHAGEAAALLGATREEVESGRLEAVRELAGRYAATVLLKGSTTVVAGPDGTGAVRVNPTGTPWLATAGSGDVLSGLAGALLAAGLGARDAGAVGAFLHGLAGRLAADGAPVAAQDVAEALPAAWRDVRRG